MSISYTILGILSYQSMTGYDLKKIIQDSTFMPWSGNNNQIYKALIELLDKGLVTNVVQHQESSPTKKIYHITKEGLGALKDWVLSPAEASEVKKPFLLQLAWSKQLNTQELNMLLAGYENQVKLQLLMEENNRQNTVLSPDRTPLEATIWDFIKKNMLQTYEGELKWIDDLKRAIAGMPNENDVVETAGGEMIRQEEKPNEVPAYIIKGNHEISYVHYPAGPGAKLETERDILEIITALAENNTPFVLFDDQVFSKNFLDSRKGLFGDLLQKFSMYHMKAAILVEETDRLKGELKASIAESSKYDGLKVFSHIGEAEAWFLSLKRKGEI